MKRILITAFVLAAAISNAQAGNKKELLKEERHIADTMETQPLVYNGRLLLLDSARPGCPNWGACHPDWGAVHIDIRDVASGKNLATFAKDYAMSCAIVRKGELFVYAVGGAQGAISMFRSRDLKNWESKIVIEKEPGEKLYNMSVCAVSDKRFIMIYETDDPQYVPFSGKYAESTDLVTWKKIPDLVYMPKKYAACPTIRYVDGYYYVLNLEAVPKLKIVGKTGYETWCYRSRDLKTWEPAPRNPILTPEFYEGTNNSDVDLVEFKGKVYLYYCNGDQATWGYLQRAVFNGTLKEFFNWCFEQPQDFTPAAK